MCPCCMSKERRCRGHKPSIGSLRYVCLLDSAMWYPGVGHSAHTQFQGTTKAPRALLAVLERKIGVKDFLSIVLEVMETVGPKPTFARNPLQICRLFYSKYALAAREVRRCARGTSSVDGPRVFVRR